MTLAVELPWPSKNLHPNARVHYMALHRAKKKAMEDAFVLTRAAEGRKLFLHDGVNKIPVTLTFHPPDRRRRDTDGMVASIKAALDGVAYGLMVDDYLFQFAAPRVLEPVKRGKVIVEIGQ